MQLDEVDVLISDFGRVLALDWERDKAFDGDGNDNGRDVGGDEAEDESSW